MKKIILLLFAVCALSSSCTNEQNKIEASGTIEVDEVRVSSKVAGEVIEVGIDDGSQVKQGDILVQIDHSSLDIQLKQAESGIKLAEAQLDLLLKGARKEDIQQAEENVKQIDESLKQAKGDVTRMKSLYQTGSATKKQRDDAETRYSVLKAQHNAASQNLKKLRNFFQPEEEKAARARLEQAKYTRELIQKTISDCTVVAPVAGFITHKLIEKGELAGIGSPLAVIANLLTVSVMIYVSEKDLGHVTLGQKANIFIDTFPETPFLGSVTYISQEAEFTPKNVQTKDERIKRVYGVKIEIANPTLVLKPGMSADAVLVYHDK